ncbi:MAG: sensor histidine kinase [Paracoccus sp. (in: a-proteobacteria)]|uniref:sensor histidine kinase n=1 Tax=Paracoccus sp. TaxID=267 RepID=UPI0026DEA939|nr:sensor histidine kinase [Paracoccus sp. (in: a-proteobacteria)]MDO5614090.1 sensor histidine kinase [Paracoccus sp. (in: a-proteobacteria)]
MTRRRRPVWRSLRARLFVMIVVPQLVIAVTASVILNWMARDVSRALYDDTLKVVAHAVAREVMVTRGDVLAGDLLRSLEGALGDPIYYQVHAAGGRFIVGRTDAPPLPAGVEYPEAVPVFYSASWNGRPVRVVVLREYITDAELDGWTTVRVWQTVTARDALTRQMLGQAAAVLALMVASVTGLVWFGINRGLSPLTDLRDAVALRSTSELRPIRRNVPREVMPLVATINSLFTRLSAELDRRRAFISNAAHQLRNPVAAIQAQAESALSARDAGDREQRLRDLGELTRRLSRLTQQLLRLDAASDGQGMTAGPPVDFTQTVAEVARRHVPAALRRGVDVALIEPDRPLRVAVNAVLLEEAVDNLIDNALKYGCPPDSELRLELSRRAGQAVLRVSDQGPGIPSNLHEAVFERFFRINYADDGGSGLGLPIVRMIARRAGGDAMVELSSVGCTIRFSLPLTQKTA